MSINCFRHEQCAYKHATGLLTTSSIMYTKANMIDYKGNINYVVCD